MKALFKYLLSCSLASLAAASTITPEALVQLPEARRDAWELYLKQSRAAAAADQAALAAELAARGMNEALKAPSGGDFKLSAKPGDPWFSGDEAGKLAGVVISYQTPAGGWSKHTGYSKGPRKPGMLWSSQYDPGRSPHYLGTFDNRSTTGQLQFLAGIASATGRDDCKAAFRKGLDYILAAQYPNGGWPQVYPLEGGYHDAITLNDDAMTHVLDLLDGVASGGDPFPFIGEAKREEAAAALGRGIACVMAMQIVMDGKPSAWCAQHDPLTLAPAAARAMEPPSLGAVESATLLRFLMKIREPEPELAACIGHGLDWLERVRIEDGEKPSWARFYDLTNNRPIFPGRDGVIYDTYEELAAHNEVKYDYLSGRPGSVLKNDRRKWLRMLARNK
jgi:PelA/Pel-15E family pectate lyase